MNQLGPDVVKEELSRSMSELAVRREEGNNLINEILTVIMQERSTLLYADDEYKKKLLNTVFEEFSIK